MMKTQWVIGKRYRDFDMERMDLFTSRIIHLGHDYMIVNDDSRDSAREMFDRLDTKIPTIVLGSIQFVNMFKQYQFTENRMFIPGYWAFDNVNMNHMIANTPSSFVIHEADWFFLPYGYMKKYGSFYFDDGSRWPFFIRPNSSKKLFAGQVINNQIEEEVFKNTFAIDNAEMVFVAKERPVFREARCIVANGKVASVNIYHNSFNKHDFTHGVFDTKSYADNVRELEWMAAAIMNRADIYRPDDVFVVDIGSFYDSKFNVCIDAIVEYNSFNSSGIYAVTAEQHDAIIKAVSDVAIRQYREIWDDFDEIHR